MGQVLLAHDPVLDRRVAVKLLRGDLGITPEQRAMLVDRMRQEARASARISHPNIVALHDMGEDERLGLFLVFEYVEGTTLKERLERGPLGPETAALLARAIGSALSTAHSAGVLHRDIKPENVILTKAGGKIADFGIARVPDSTLTRSGGLLGTPAYSAPEAIEDGTFSPRSDQFSMAASFWEVLTGRRAFPGADAVAVATKIATEEPPRISELCGLDPHVDTVFARALAKQPDARFPSCEEFGCALAEALESMPRAAMQTLPDEQHRQAARSGEEARMMRIGAGGLAAGVLLAIAGFQLTEKWRRPAQPTPPLPVPQERPPQAPTGYLAPTPPASGRTRPRRLPLGGVVGATPLDAGHERDAAALQLDGGESALADPPDARSAAKSMTDYD